MKAIKAILVLVQIASALSLICAYLAPYFSPEEAWVFAFFGLALPFLFVVNILFAIYWLASKQYKILIGVLMVLLMGSNYVPSYLQVFPKTLKDTSGINLRLIDFNTHYMGAYDFQGNDSNFFFSLIDTLAPDIMCFQEFTNMSGSFEKPMFQRFFNHYRNYANVNADALSTTFPTGYGVCIFSKYPIINKGFLELVNQTSNLTVFADVVVGKDTIRIVNTHLKSIVFDQTDYKTFEVIEKAESTDLRRIVAKLKYAFKARAKQAGAVRERLEKSPYPLIVCGDFNDSPASYSYYTIKGKLKDSFKESGFGMSRTYIGKMPSFRIDYILHDAKWQSFDYKTNRLNFSDHKMISCTIKIK
jgi:endonuclease/exonuclease/phosphatase family metal-dependent hydrolase